MSARASFVTVVSALSLGLAVSGLAAFVACSNQTLVPCTDIPDGGCPLIDLDADECGDPSCAAIYVCESPNWQLLGVCPVQACLDIPDGGCPLIAADADECGDPACNTLYTCVNGAWVYAESCSYTGPSSEDGGEDAGDDAAEDAGDDASGDASDGGSPIPPGAYGGDCTPALEDTDCQLGEVLTDPALCSTGACDELWTCAPSGNWISWGSCEDGGIVPNP